MMSTKTPGVFPEKASKALTLHDNLYCLNLNVGKHQYPAVPDTVHSKSTSFFKEKFYTEPVNDHKRWNDRNCSWKKDDSRITLSSFQRDVSNLYDSTIAIEKAKNRSMQSLYIIAHENEDEQNSVAKPLPKKASIKPWETKFTLVGPAVYKCFIFHRQQQDSPNEPEVSQFRASQRLHNPNSVPKKMKLWCLSATGWKEFADVPSSVSKDNVYALLSFRAQLCDILPAPQAPLTTAMALNLKTNEIQFQRAAEDVPVIALLCSITVQNQENNDPDADYNLVVHCQVASQHLEFTVSNSLLTFEDDEQPPVLPEDFVTLVTTTDGEMVSEADHETHVVVVTPAREQIKNLLVSLKQNHDSIYASPTRPIPTSKLHHNLTVRSLCPARIDEIRSLIENKQLDLNSVVFHVVNHSSIADNFEIAKGNQTFAAYLQLKNAKKSVPPTLKCKIYETTPTFGILEIALGANKISKDQPLSYMEKVAAVRRTLEKNSISRDSVTKNKLSDLKLLFNYFFPAEEMPRSFPLLVGLSVEDFEKCFAAGKKFTNGEIRYSLNKPIPYVPPQYKSNNVKTLNSDSFWLGFGTCYRQSATFALNCLVKLSSSYCIEDCVKDFKSPDIDFQQQLKNSGVAFTGNLEDAILAFGLPASTTVEQAHFLLTNRFIQRQLTRTPNFSIDKAKANISKFMENVNVTQFEHVEEVTDLRSYKFIACFAEVDWEILELPKDGLILDFHYGNKATLGQEIPVTWNIQLITKGLTIPANGNLPMRTLQVRIFKINEGAEKDADIARSLLQDMAELKQIEVGNVMDISEMPHLFKFAEEQSSCLIVEPPLNWYDLIISAVINNIPECTKLTLVTKNSNGAERFKDIFSKLVAVQWQKKAEKFGAPAKKRGKKRGRESTSIPPPPNPPLPASPARSTQ